MLSLKHYINEVEADMRTQFLNAVSSKTHKGAVTADVLAQWQRDIETDENGFKGGLTADDDNEMQLMRDKAEKLQQQRVLNNKRKIQQQRQQAEISGYKQAGRDEYNDYMGKVKKHVAAMADKKTSKLAQQRKAIALMAKRSIS
jgi:hypothetical protein